MMRNMMRPLLLLLAVLCLGLSAPVERPKLYSQDPVRQRTIWQNFKDKYGRNYPKEEESRRFMAFLSNLKLADDRNFAEGPGGAIHGVTQFSDLTYQEFKTLYLSARSNLPNSTNIIVVSVRGGDYKADWEGTYTTPVKDQGQCGSCWAHSATEQIESDVMRTLGVYRTLSVDQINSCIYANGCKGGQTGDAYNYVKRSKGLLLDASAPYRYTPTNPTQGIADKCPGYPAYPAVTVTGYHTVRGEDQMASYVDSTGPLSICVDASNWNTYISGVMTNCGRNVDHCVQAIGVDTVNGFWRIRNSWGTTFGERGFIRLAYGRDTCALTQDATYTTVANEFANDYMITFWKNQNMCLDLKGGDTTNGTPIDLWECNGLDNQMWRFDAGSYAIKHYKDPSKCVDISGGNLAPGTPLQIWDCNGGTGQQWGYDPNMRTIWAGASSAQDASLCIDLPGGTIYNGATLQVWNCGSAETQQWTVGPQNAPTPTPTPTPTPVPGQTWQCSNRWGSNMCLPFGGTQSYQDCSSNCR